MSYIILTLHNPDVIEVKSKMCVYRPEAETRQRLHIVLAASDWMTLVQHDIFQPEGQYYLF